MTVSAAPITVPCLPMISAALSSTSTCVPSRRNATVGRRNDPSVASSANSRGGPIRYFGATRSSPERPMISPA